MRLALLRRPTVVLGMSPRYTLGSCPSEKFAMLLMFVCEVCRLDDNMLFACFVVPVGALKEPTP